MKAVFSNYLNSLADGLHVMIDDLMKDYDYVSVLATDSSGLQVNVSQKQESVGTKSITTERGIVVRVHVGGHYSEYALNHFDPANPHAAAEEIRAGLTLQEELMGETNTSFYQTDILPDKPCTLYWEAVTGEMPEKCDLERVIRTLKECSDDAMKASPYSVEAMTRMSSNHINKMFLTKNRDMRQSYVYTEAVLTPVVSKDGRTENGYKAVSGMKGPEIVEELKKLVNDGVRQAEEILFADRIVPGEYEIITSPEVSGLIAHEAFGHGVEMDMFVKHRALGADYIGKRVGSDLVTMHEGAKCAENVTSYVFDDEGVLAGDVTEIQNGILQTGICDSLSALRLGITPTGNGKRQNYEHKAYTRMTNTLFDFGKDSVEDMIASVSHGYLLEGMQSGMEDPKHWGIQCILTLGKEIKDGKLTGKVVSPVIMTGYVPDLLGNITMASKSGAVFGSGTCGKGYKEYVKVADGGPYLKTKGRLG